MKSAVRSSSALISGVRELFPRRLYLSPNSEPLGAPNLLPQEIFQMLNERRHPPGRLTGPCRVQWQVVNVCVRNKDIVGERHARTTCARVRD